MLPIWCHLKTKSLNCNLTSESATRMYDFTRLIPTRSGQKAVDSGLEYTSKIDPETCYHNFYPPGRDDSAALTS